MKGYRIMEEKTFLVRGISVNYEVLLALGDAWLVKTSEEGKALMLSDHNGGNIAIKMPNGIEKLDEQILHISFAVLLSKKCPAWHLFVLKDEAEDPDRFVLCYDKFGNLCYGGSLPENRVVLTPMSGFGLPSITNASDVFVFFKEREHIHFDLQHDE